MSEASSSQVDGNIVHRKIISESSERVTFNLLGAWKIGNRNNTYKTLGKCLCCMGREYGLRPSAQSKRVGANRVSTIN